MSIDIQKVKTISAAYNKNWKHIITCVSTEEYGKRVEQLRESYGMTQQELGEQVGITRQGISRIEKGLNKKISWNLFRRFASIFDCSKEYLLGYVDEKKGELSKLELYKIEYPNETSNIECINQYLQENPSEKLVKPFSFVDESEAHEEDVKRKLIGKLYGGDIFDVELVELLLELFDGPQKRINDVKAVLKLLKKYS